MKKVLIVLPADLPVPSVLGGAIETIVQLLIDINEREKRYKFTVISAYHSKAENQSQSYLHSNFIWIRRNKLYHFCNFFIRIARKFYVGIHYLDCYIIRNKIKNTRFDRIIVEGNAMHLLALAKGYPREELLFHVHANLFRSPSRFFSEVGQSAGVFIAVSNFIREEIIGKAGADSSKVVVVQNPIDLDRFSCAIDKERTVALVKKYGIKTSEAVLLFVGRIVENKGIGLLLEALIQLQTATNFKLIVIGTMGSSFGKGHCKDAFYDRLMVLAEKLDQRIIFTGFVHNSELPRYHALADMVIMPSLCDEAAGLVAIEAMASGLPVIATKSGGLPEYVTPDCGILISRNEEIVNNLAKGIYKLIQDPGLRRSMGSACKERAKLYSPEIFYNQLSKYI